MAAPVPELDPPGVRSRSHGFFGMRKPVSGSGQPVAYSWSPSLPVMTAPAARSFLTTVASRPAPQAEIHHRAVRRRRRVRGGDDVLDGDRDALQRPLVDAGREVGVGLRGGGQRGARR